MSQTKPEKPEKPVILKKVEPVNVMPNGSITDNVSWEIVEMSLDKFVGKLLSGNYDTDVVFQRDEVWSYEMQGNLIRSILIGAPIGDCLLCEKPYNVAHANVIDFKNRSFAIKNFWTNKFAVPINLVNGDGTTTLVNLTWKEIENSPDPRLMNMRDKIPNYKIRCVVYKDLTLVQQAARWQIQNTQIPPNTEELLYGENFWVKGLFRVVYYHCMQEVIKHARGNQEKNNEHEKGTIFAHRLFYTCYGGQLDDVWAVRDLGNSKTRGRENASPKPMVRDAIVLNEYLGTELEKEKTQTMDLSFVKKLKFWPKVEQFKKVCTTIADILECENPAPKHFNKNDLFDVIAFFNKYVLNDSITLSMMRDNKKKFLDIIRQFEKNKKGKTGQSVTTKMISERLELFDELLKNADLDLGTKNRKPTEREVTVAYLDSGSTCPVTGEAISGRNARIEHENCRAKHSDTQFTIVSSTGNQWKAERTLEEIKAVEKYQKTKQASLHLAVPASSS